MSMVDFIIRPIANGYYIIIVDNKQMCIYKYNNDIALYLQVNFKNFNETLKIYGGTHKDFRTGILITTIVYFTNKENAKLFIKEYLEPQLIVKELSK